MEHTIYYTALKVFDAKSTKDYSWTKYIEWSKLDHLKELVSLDGMLNSLVFEPDLSSADEWNNVVTEGEFITDFFHSLEYVLKKTKHRQYFNLLAVIKEPTAIKADLSLEYEFIGYELLDKETQVSALTNCGGFDETFLPKDLNSFGLVSDYDKVREIQQQLPINKPEERHTDCYLYEVWRHKIIGRKNAKENLIREIEKGLKSGMVEDFDPEKHLEELKKKHIKH